MKDFIYGRLALLFLLCVLFSVDSFSKVNFSDLNKNSFYDKPKVRQSFLLGGGYKSDYNSHEYDILSGYKYRSNRFIHEIDFLHETTYSSTTTRPLSKSEELYDLEFSSRMLLENSRNYLNIYNRTQYDEFSDFYYDMANAVGLGRLFFGGRFEASLNFGHNEVKNFNSENIVIGMLRSKFQVTDKLKISIRGLLTQKEQVYDENIRNIISYRLDKNLSFEILHKYEKDRYVGNSKKLGDHRVNRVKREYYARVKYSF